MTSPVRHLGVGRDGGEAGDDSDRASLSEVRGLGCGADGPRRERPDARVHVSCTGLLGAVLLARGLEEQALRVQRRSQSSKTSWMALRSSTPQAPIAVPPGR
ncbi:MAG: hypothetical protein ACP5O0_10025 [Acidimicrobiales bacterium]